MPEPLLLALDTLPRHAYPFLWADYVELLCLCSRNGFVASGNLNAKLQEAEDVQADTLPTDNGDGQDDGDHSDPDPDADARMDDRVSARWSDIHQRLQARSHYPGWPFQLEGQVLRSNFDSDKPGHRLYAALLIASTLRLCHKTRVPDVTGDFEAICYHWLRHSLNEHWQVRPFGANQTLPGAYTGTLVQKLTALALDICATRVKLDDAYDPADRGDGGLDLVAWLDMDDPRGHMPLVFGQCACSPTDWESKQLDVTPAAVEAHLYAQHPGAAYCFVPHDLSAGTQWQRWSQIKRAVVVDRLRLLSLFARRNWANVPPLPFVAEARQLAVVPAT